MIKIRGVLLLVVIFGFFVSGLSFANTESANQATEIVRSLCLVGNGYVVEAEGEGAIKIFKKSVAGSVKFTQKELKGVVDVADNERKAELDSIRLCIQPYIKQILDAVLEKNTSVKIKEKDNSSFFLSQDFSNIEEGLVPTDWIMAENLLIEIKDGKHVLVSNPLKNNNKITIPNISFPKNFIINLTAKIEYDGIIEMKLSNNIFRFKAHANSKMSYKINAAMKEIKETFVGQKAIFSIRKEGKVFKIYVNGIKKMVSRISNFENPEALEINFNDAVNGFEMYKIEGKIYLPEKS